MVVTVNELQGKLIRECFERLHQKRGIKRFCKENKLKIHIIDEMFFHFQVDIVKSSSKTFEEMMEETTNEEFYEYYQNALIIT